METLEYGWGVRVQHNDDTLTSHVLDNGNCKTFFGETAWMDAERFAYDLVISRKYA